MIKGFCKTINEAFEMIKKHWKSDRGYNICMSERNSARAPKWFQDFVKGPFSEMNNRLFNVEKDLSEVKSRIGKLEVEVGKINERLAVLEQDMAIIKSLPTIKREIELKLNN